MRRLLSIFLFLFTVLEMFATHNRSGEITYIWVAPMTIKATITTCTKTSSPADRDLLTLLWGDGQADSLFRDNANIIYFPSYDVQVNSYTGTHTYLGPGTYELCFIDPNRNDGILNINSGASVNEPFSVTSSIKISAFCGNGTNNSVQFLECPCPEIGCINQPYYYIPGAYDPDGDSLTFELVACKQDCYSPVTNYSFPLNMTIDPVTGIVSWLTPPAIGEWNIAIKIHEWRGNCEIGYVTIDLQITIANCSNNPPEIAPIPDTCVEAGTTLNLQINTTDPNGDNITVSGNGQPFIVPVSPAFLSGTTSGTAPITTDFTWNTTCDHISSIPYQVYFTAEDDDPMVVLSDIESMFITVIAPALTGLSAQALGNTILLTWNSGTCGNITGYYIYQSIGPGSGSLGCCSSGSLENFGYTLIGQTNSASDTTFIDNSGLIIGQEYCYVIVAFYEDGVTSCPSTEVCTYLNNDVPVITNVSVVTTNTSVGIDSVCWSKPTELDTLIFPPPYHFKVYRNYGFSGNSSLIYTGPYAGSWAALNDTCFEDNLPKNTADSANNYSVELYYTSSLTGDELVGTTNSASSIFLTLTPNDNQIGLSWHEEVPWTNTYYDIYKSTDGGTSFFYLDSTTGTTYIDTGLINGTTYCYKVKSVGGYSFAAIVSPITNWSQQACDFPWDYTAPCPPVLAIADDCANEINDLWWNNPNNSCSDDVIGYNLYYTPIVGNPFTLIATMSSPFDTTYSHSNNGSIAGCYYVTAFDSAQYGNESDSSNIICIHNCPHYSLPNVFTPNGDGVNDWFIPFPYQYVDSINLKIFNRWGQEIFTTTNPDILWDGTEKVTGKDVPEGVYYYICTVYAIDLEGVIPVSLSGFMHLFRGNTKFGN